MSEKRFMLDDAGELIDLNTHKFIEYGEECCNLLNELHEENDVLKQQLQTKYVVNKQYEELQRLKKDNKELEKENEQLQRELDCFHPVMFQDMRKGTVVLYLKELE